MWSVIPGFLLRESQPEVPFSTLHPSVSPLGPLKVPGIESYQHQITVNSPTLAVLILLEVLEDLLVFPTDIHSELA
jgi:hypothetical protein